jgi:hypothetical protein
MKTFSIVAAAAVALIGFADVTYAHDRPGVRDPGVNARQVNQRDRIRQGVRSGELTRRETRRVVETQRDVRQLERAYKSDGVLTRRERADLHREQNQASRQIYRQKHDGQERG